MTQFEEDDIYGAAPVPVSPSMTSIPDKDPKLPDPVPEDDGRTVDARVTGVSWWITEDEITQALSLIGTVVRLELIPDLVNGKFTGAFECTLRTDEPDSFVLDGLKQLKFDESLINCVLTRKTTQKAAAPGVTPQIKPKKPAPMLYEDASNPIPKALLRDSRDKSEFRSKKPDDFKKPRREDRDRDGKRRDDRDRDRDRDRRHKTSYSDYGYSSEDDDYYDYDYRRKDDRDGHRGKKRRDANSPRDKRRK
jgi:hypothetical protein